MLTWTWQIDEAAWEGCLYSKNRQPKTIHNHEGANRFSFEMLFLLFYPESLDTAVNRWAVFSLSKTRLSNPWAAKPIFVQFAIIFGVYARLETLYTHMTFARFAQGLAALHVSSP